MSRAASNRPTEPSPFRFSVEDYYLLAQAGAFGETTHTELIEGEIIEMPPAGPEHSGILSRLCRSLILTLPDRYDVRCQLALKVNENTELEPDLAVMKTRDDHYTRSHPSPADAFLVIEISKSSLSYDLNRKTAVYAKSGVREYWVVDLDGRKLHVLTQPAGDSYTMSRTLHPGEEIQCLSIPELKLPVEQLFV
jgi:Uma2 family endonuclease